jgi:hypothetical protein
MTDEKIIARVRALLAKAESTDNLDEQAAYIGKAAELQARHNIDAAKLQAAGAAPAEEVATVGIEVARHRQPGGRALVSLLAAVVRANGADVVIHSGRAGTRATVIGFPSDLRAVEALFSSLVVQVGYAAGRAVRDHRPPAVHGLTYRVSYTHGWVDAVADRLHAARHAAVADASAQDAGAGPTSTAVVLRSRDERVAARRRQLFPRLGTFRDGYRPDASGYRRGAADGERAALGGDLPAGDASRALVPGVRG